MSDYLGDIADTLGFDIKVSTSQDMITGSLDFDVEVMSGFKIKGRADIVSNFHDKESGVVIIAARIVGNLGMLVYTNSVEVDGSPFDCNDVVFYDDTKLGFSPSNYFEKNASQDIEGLAKAFENGLMCHVRRFVGEKHYSLIEDRRLETRQKNEDDVLDSGGSSPDQEDLQAIPSELPT